MPALLIDTCELTDDQLAERIARRDASLSNWHDAQADFEQLYRRHAGRLLGFLAARVRRSELDDVHQAVWLRVWQTLPQQYHGGRFRAWLFRIARNYLIDLSRRRQVELLDEGGDISDCHGASPDEALLESERTEVLRDCLGRLRSDLADIVRARLLGESYDEISARTEMKPERIHKLFFAAKEQLSTCVKRVLK